MAWFSCWLFIGFFKPQSSRLMLGLLGVRFKGLMLEGCHTTLEQHTSEVAGKCPVGTLFLKHYNCQELQASPRKAAGLGHPLLNSDLIYSPCPADLHPLRMPLSTVTLVPRAMGAYRAGVVFLSSRSGNRF